MTGRELLAVLRRLDADELDLDARVLVDLHDGAVCLDCYHHHPDPWAAIACDERVDARRRRHAARHHRRRAREEGAA